MASRLLFAFAGFFMKPLEVCPTSGGQFNPGAIQDFADWARKNPQPNE